MENKVNRVLWVILVLGDYRVLVVKKEIKETKETKVIKETLVL
jgi:hypothetical protein